MTPNKIKKIIDHLNLDDDFLFAKVMSDQEICRKVLEQILHIDIKEIKYLSGQKGIDLAIDSKAVRLDVYVNDENNTIYNVEMQKSNERNLPKRSRYYQGIIDLDNLQKGKEYNKLNKSFIIFICTFDPFNQNRHLYTFENRCIEELSLSLQDETTKIFLNTKGTLNDVEQEMIEFLTYIENSTDEYANQVQSNLVRTINNKVKHLKNDKSLEVEYMTLYELYEEKFQAGVEKTKLENAKSLLDILDDETIATKIGLDLETVQKLRVESLNS